MSVQRRWKVAGFVLLVAVAVAIASAQTAQAQTTPTGCPAGEGYTSVETGTTESGGTYTICRKPTRTYRAMGAETVTMTPSVTFVTPGRNERCVTNTAHGCIGVDYVRQPVEPVHPCDRAVPPASCSDAYLNYQVGQAIDAYNTAADRADEAYDRVKNANLHLFTGTNTPAAVERAAQTQNTAVDNAKAALERALARAYLQKLRTDLGTVAVDGQVGELLTHVVFPKNDDGDIESEDGNTRLSATSSVDFVDGVEYEDGTFSGTPTTAGTRRGQIEICVNPSVGGSSEAAQCQDIPVTVTIAPADMMNSQRGFFDDDEEEEGFITYLPPVNKAWQEEWWVEGED